MISVYNILLNTVCTPFLYTGITFAIFILSWNIPVVSTWFDNKARDLVSAG